MLSPPKPPRRLILSPPLPPPLFSPPWQFKLLWSCRHLFITPPFHHHWFACRFYRYRTVRYRSLPYGTVPVAVPHCYLRWHVAAIAAAAAFTAVAVVMELSSFIYYRRYSSLFCCVSLSRYGSSTTRGRTANATAAARGRVVCLVVFTPCACRGTT